MTLSIFALVRDMGAGNVVEPTLRELKSRGHRVCLCAEKDGQAANRLPSPFTVIETPEDLKKVFDAGVPHIVLSGLSAPRVLETELDKMALVKGLPLVYIEDYWGAHRRSPYGAALYVVVDELAASLVRDSHLTATTAVAGFAGIMPVIPPPKLLGEFNALRGTGAKILVYPDGGPECAEALPILVESILRTRRRIILASRIHPKYKNVSRPHGTGTWGEWCESVLMPLRSSGAICETSAYSTDEVVEAADGVVSGFSSTLMRPASSGKVALTLWGGAIQTLLQQETGLSETPLMIHGGFPILDRAQPLDVLFERKYPRYEVSPFNASLAADAIESLP